MTALVQALVLSNCILTFSVKTGQAYLVWLSVPAKIIHMKLTWVMAALNRKLCGFLHSDTHLRSVSNQYTTL